jgi:alkanesulfonate monooxygenase SsuD/methylene tetrahydromethanopterin reductase-like flavin-dependent oxidoreductase (luciferase family)
VAVSSPETAIQAAERGNGLHGDTNGTPEEYSQRVKDYRRIIKSCEPVGDFVNDQVNGVTFMYVDETDEEANLWGTKLVYSFSLLASQFIGVSSIYPTGAYTTPGLLFAIRRSGAKETGPAGGGAIRDGMAVGSPQTVIKNLKMWEEIGVDRMVFILNTAEQIPQEKVLRSLEMFAEHVIPAFDKSEKPARAANGARTGKPLTPAPMP